MVKYGKELQHMIFWETDSLLLKELQRSGSGLVLFFWFRRLRVNLVLDIIRSQKSLLCTCFGCMTFGFILLFLKNNSVSC